MRQNPSGHAIRSGGTADVDVVADALVVPVRPAGHRNRHDLARFVLLAALACTASVAAAQATNSSAAESPDTLAGGAATASSVAAVGSSADDSSADDSSVAASEPARLAAQAILLDSVRLDDVIVAVGERGTIVRGAGDSWQQIANVPTRATLTAVFAMPPAVWAVGHDGVILHSADAGLTWQRQRVDAWRADSDDPQTGVPLLDVFFLDAQHGLAIGAYSLMLETRDAGTTWVRRSLLDDGAEVAAVADPQVPADGTVAAEPDADADADADSDNASWNFSADELDLEQEDDPHLNAITRTGSGGLIIASERGTAFRSRDSGSSWQRLKLPYQGSMFGAIGFSGDHALLFGLRGNVLETFDLGDTWHELESGVEASLMGGTGIGQGGAVLVGANGVLLRRDNAEAKFAISRFRTREGESPILSGVVVEANGGLIVLGERGIAPFRN